MEKEDAAVGYADDELFSRSWHQAWSGLGARSADTLLMDTLLACYAEPHRAYHTRQHLWECLAWLQRFEAQAERPAEIAVALWFHDAIYQPSRHDNEALCANWARAAMWAAGADADAAERVHALVLATQHQALPQGTDQQLLIDIDLAILGAPPQRFDEDERQVRIEYAAGPEQAFRIGRRKILQSFLDRPALYGTVPPRQCFEAQARVNLQRSIALLGG
jgi:predicted metal-dependent HD superfamily phosphohydrolase